jgi:FMN phosphatase YigB (HAD superfamily)
MENIKHSSNKTVIVFDLGGVILKFSHLSICERLSDISHTPVNEIYGFIFNNSLESRYDTGEITSNDFYMEIKNYLKIDLSFNGFYDIWTNIFEENVEISKIIAGLKEQNHRLFLLSNTNEMHFNFVKSKFAIVNIFDGSILSYEAGRKKPDINIFKEVLRKTGAAANDHVYIDDIKENVIAAQSIGMFGIYFKNADKLKKDLADYLQI